jgi:hypothetical protein
LGRPGSTRSITPSTHLLGDAGRLAHEGDLLVGLDAPLPVDERGRVDELGLRQFLPEDEVGLGGEIIVLQFEPDPFFAVATVPEDRRQILHGMAHVRLHVGVRVAGDILIGHPDRADRAVGVLRSSPPDRVCVVEDDHALMHVERPAVIAGDPRHVRRVLHEKYVDVARGHGLAHLRETPRILAKGERQTVGRHSSSSGIAPKHIYMCTSTALLRH